MADFFLGGSREDFEAVFRLYPRAVKVKAEEKKKKKGESLQALDKWMQEELGSSIGARNPPHVTRQELVRVMDWKLSRGKFRPKLIDFAASNGEDEVVKATGKGIRLGSKGEVDEALKAISVLKGIGPATASAILTIACPEFFCFFADEVARCALPPPPAPLRYTLQEYAVLNGAVVLCAERLNEGCGSGEVLWTAHRVELAVWTYCVLQGSHPHLLPSVSSTSSSTSPPTKKRRK